MAANSRKSVVKAEPVRKQKARSRVMAAIHEMARGQQRVGIIDSKAMRDFDLLCLVQVPPYGAEDVRRLRRRLKLSQPVFAAALNVSTSTVRQWEIGEKKPSGPSLKLLNLLDRKGLEVLL